MVPRAQPPAPQAQDLRLIGPARQAPSQIPQELQPLVEGQRVPVLPQGAERPLVRVEGDQVLVTLAASDNSSFRGFGGLMGGGMVRRIDR